jgi:uncharacterized protein YidB (DUF937 family)
MSLLNDVLGGLAGAAGGQGGGNVLSGLMGLAGGGEQNNALNMAMNLVNSYPGGIGGLLGAFQNGGLGEVASSWVGTGQNLPVSTEQLTSVLGNDQIQALAGQMGVSPEAATSSLASVLPGLIDKLSPDGNMPGNDVVQQGLGMLAQQLFK